MICQTGNKLVDNAVLPTDALFCFDCCTSRDQVNVGANQCLDPGTVMYLDDTVWKRIPTGPIDENTFDAPVGILFTSVNTMDGKVGRAVVIRDNARIVAPKLTWNTGVTTGNKTFILGLLDARSVKAGPIPV